MNKDGGITFSVRADFDEAALMRRFRDGASRAQKKLDAQVIADSNFYCPLKTGTLQRSATIGSVIGSGTVRWVTPYARRQYYGVGFDRSKDPNPNATAKWFEAAKARKQEQWRRLVEDEIRHS